MKNQINYKSVSTGASLKDVDIKGRTITGYFSAFGNIDSDNDVIMPGSFNKSIAENGPSGSNRIQFLLQHDPLQPLGKPSVLKEDNIGLYFESKIANTTWGSNTLILYDAGVINEHSIGFQTVKSMQKMDYNEITEIKLWEGSAVTFGANPSTPFLGMKNMIHSKDEVNKKFDAMLKGIKAGTFAGDNEYLLDLSFAQFKSWFADALNHTQNTDSITLNAIPELGEILDPLKHSSQAVHTLDPAEVTKLINALFI